MCVCICVSFVYKEKSPNWPNTCNILDDRTSTPIFIAFVFVCKKNSFASLALFNHFISFIFFLCSLPVTMLTKWKICFLNLWFKPEKKKKLKGGRTGKNKYIETQTNTQNIQPGFSVCINIECMYIQHIDYANLHYTSKSNGTYCASLRCPL